MENYCLYSPCFVYKVWATYERKQKIAQIDRTEDIVVSLSFIQLSPNYVKIEAL